MATCTRDPSHVYPPHNKTCPWCAIAATPPATAKRPAQQTALPPPAVAPRPVAPATTSRPGPNPTRATTNPASPQLSPQVRKAKRIPLRTTVSDFFGFGVALAVVWVLTPVVASFGTLAFGDRLSDIVFMNGETGSTSGDGPETLYGMLARAMIGVWLACLAARLVIERKSNRVEPFFVGAVVAGIGLLYFLYQLVQESLTPDSWYWAPIGFAAGYVAASGVTLWHGSRGHQLP